MSKNVTTVDLGDGRTVLLSYGVPVAAFVPGRGYVKTDKFYSVTTSRHANAFSEKRATVVPHDEFLTLVGGPLTARGGY
jgi:hypothetical protein